MMQVVWALRETEQLHKVISVENVFSREEIETIKQYAATLEERLPFVGISNKEPPALKDSVRKCQVKWITPEDETKWIFHRLVDIIQKVNGQFFNLNLYGLHPLQYTIYTEKDQGFYTKHRDVAVNSENGFARKLSFSLQLTEPSEYEGGELITDVDFNPVTAPKTLGVINFFVSDLLHEAKPVTKGTRHVLVGWVVGPPIN